MRRKNKKKWQLGHINIGEPRHPFYFNSFVEYFDSNIPSAQ